MGHRKTPVNLDVTDGYIGEPPRSIEVGQSALKMFKYLNNFNQMMQIYSYSQSRRVDATYLYGDVASDSAVSGQSEVDAYYYLSMWLPTKADTTRTARQLHGVLLPWHLMSIDDHNTTWTDYPLITWQQNGGAVQTLYDSKILSVPSDSITDTNYNSPANMGLAIQLGGDTTNSKFTYVPNGGSYTWGRLRTHQIRTATLGVWTGPDDYLTDAQAQFKPSRLAANTFIRGYTTTAAKRSLGNLIHVMGTDVNTDDDCWNVARRTCVLSIGVPVGIYTTDTSYGNISRTGTTYKIPPRSFNNTSYAEATYEATVVVIYRVEGASVGDAGACRVTSTQTADTAVVSDESDTASWNDMTAWPEIGTDTIELNASGDTVTIETKAPDNGGSEGHYILHSVQIWDTDDYIGVT